MGTGLLSRQKKIWFFPFLFFFLHVSISEDYSPPIKMCDRKTIEAVQKIRKVDWLSEFDSFEGKCKKKCRFYTANLISAWAFSNGYSKINEPICIYGSIHPQEENTFSASIIFPERAFDPSERDPERRLPLRLLGPSIFGGCFEFQIKPLQILGGGDLRLGPNPEGIECFEINFGNPLKTDDPRNFQEFIGKSASITIIFDKNGNVEKWFVVGGMEPKNFGEWEPKGIEKKIDFLKETKIIFPKKFKPLLGSGFFFHFWMDFTSAHDGAEKIQMLYECGGKWKKQSFEMVPGSKQQWQIEDFDPEKEKPR